MSENYLRSNLDILMLGYSQEQKDWCFLVLIMLEVELSQGGEAVKNIFLGMEEMRKIYLATRPPLDCSESVWFVGQIRSSYQSIKSRLRTGRYQLWLVIPWLSMNYEQAQIDTRN